jgi:hypothetical protein
LNRPQGNYLPLEEGVPHTIAADDDLVGEKRSPWVSLREALDQDQVGARVFSL